LFFGFNSFEGLPEDWVTGGKSAGSYKTTSGSLGNLDSRVTLVPGWFNESIPRFFSDSRIFPESVRIVMFDADLFSSTVVALAGTTMNEPDSAQLWIFDEFVPEEARALEVFVKGFGLRVTPIASDKRHMHVAFRVESPLPAQP